MIIKTDKLDYLGLSWRSDEKHIYLKTFLASDKVLAAREVESGLAHFFFIHFHLRTMCNHSTTLTALKNGKMG